MTDLLSGLRQPDQLSCGASVLVAAQMLRNPSYAEFVTTGRGAGVGLSAAGTRTGRFRDEVLAMHRRVTGPVDVRGRLQLPWPRALGTPPWAIAHQLDAGWWPILPRWRAAAFDRIRAALTEGPVPLYLGSRALPRHVILVLPTEEPDRLTVYDPAIGGNTQLSRADFVAGRIRVAGWPVPWLAVTAGSRSAAAGE